MVKAQELNDYNINLEKAYLAQENELQILRELKLRVAELNREAETSGLVKTKSNHQGEVVTALVATGKRVTTEGTLSTDRHATIAEPIREH
jgi:DNA-directed RNA polymerase subunit H (RpoH/RPB5)